MKITKSKLKQIIKEELGKTLNEETDWATLSGEYVRGEHDEYEKDQAGTLFKYGYRPGQSYHSGEREVKDPTGILGRKLGGASDVKRLLRMLFGLKSKELQQLLDREKKELTWTALEEDCGDLDLFGFAGEDGRKFARCASRKLNKLKRIEAIASYARLEITDRAQKKKLAKLESWARTQNKDFTEMALRALSNQERSDKDEAREEKRSRERE